MASMYMFNVEAYVAVLSERPPRSSSSSASPAARARPMAEASGASAARARPMAEASGASAARARAMAAPAPRAAPGAVRLYEGFVLGEILGYGVAPFLAFLDARRGAAAARGFREHLGANRCGLALVRRDLAARGLRPPPRFDAAGDAVAAFRNVARSLRVRLLVVGAARVRGALGACGGLPAVPACGRGVFFSLLNATGAPLECRWVGPAGVAVDRGPVDRVAALPPPADPASPIVLPTSRRSYGKGVAGHFAHSCALGHAFAVGGPGGPSDVAYQIRCTGDAGARRGGARVHAVRVDALGAGAAVAELRGTRFERGLGARALAALAADVGAPLAYSVGSRRALRPCEGFFLFEAPTAANAAHLTDGAMRLQSLRKLADRAWHDAPEKRPFPLL